MTTPPPPPLPASLVRELEQEASVAAAKVAESEAKAAAEKAASDEAHVKAALLAGSDPNLTPTDAGAALLYVRGRAFQLLRPAWDALQSALENADTKAGVKIELALEIVKRAVGNATVPNGIGADLSKMVPSEAIDLVMQHAAEGRISMEFADGLIKTLKSKVKAQQAEQVLRNQGNRVNG